MATKRSGPVEGLMEKALRPDRFIDYRTSWEFVRGLEEVKREIDRLIETQPRQAVELLETFIAGCYEKAEEIDDSSGSFGMFVGDLFCAWIEARQAAKAAPHATVKQLLGWMDNDDYGFCHGIEKNAVKAFNKAGLKTFAEVAREEFAKAMESVKAREQGDRNTPGSFRFRRLSDVLRAIYAAQRDADGYLALVEATELAPSDCAAIAKIYQARRKPHEALNWVQRGLGIKGDRYPGDGSSYSLAELKRTLLKSLGNEEEALDSAWEEFQEHPSEYSYKTLMKYVPEGRRQEWHGKALIVAQGASLRDAIALYVETKEWDRLAELVRRSKPTALEDLSHYTTEPAAKKLEKSHHDAAAMLYRALGLRILNAKKSKYYDAALDHFDRARRCFQKAGLGKEWEAMVDLIRSEHHRKAGFIQAFDALLSRGSLPRPQSFLDRARKRRSHHFRGGEV